MGKPVASNRESPNHKENSQKNTGKAAAGNVKKAAQAVAKRAS